MRRSEVLRLADQVIEVGSRARCPAGRAAGCPMVRPGADCPTGSARHCSTPWVFLCRPPPLPAPDLRSGTHLGRGGCAGCARPYDTPGRAADTRARGGRFPGRPRYCRIEKAFQAMGEELVEAVRRALRAVRDPGNGARRRRGRHGPGPHGARRAGAVRPRRAARAGARAGTAAAGGRARRRRRARRAERNGGADGAPRRRGGGGRRRRRDRSRGRTPAAARPGGPRRLAEDAGGAGAHAAAGGGRRSSPWPPARAASASPPPR